MAANWFFAWVNSGSVAFNATLHAVEDEDVFLLQLNHAESESATAEVTLRNPSVGLLSPARKQWAWISHDAGAGAVPLFLGRLVALPQDLAENVVTLQFVARPLDLDASKNSVAAGLRNLPYYDPVWLNEEVRSDADAVLEARPATWHIDPASHAVSVTSLLAGEDGTLAFGDGDVFEGSLDLAVGEAPLRRIEVQAEARWVQRAVGALDISAPLCKAFETAGTPWPYVISSYTGDGLFFDWPDSGDDIGAGWSFGKNRMAIADGVAFPEQFLKVKASYMVAPVETEVETGIGVSSYSVSSGGGSGGYYSSLPTVALSGQRPSVTLTLRHYAFFPNLTVLYDAARTRTEILKFILTGDCQALQSDPGADETESLVLASTALTEMIDAGPAMPLGDLRRATWFNTTRGLSGLHWLLAKARSMMLQRARAVDVSFTTALDMARLPSLRKSATLTSARLPGGTATGKIKAYSIAVEDGRMSMSLTLGCMVGRGNSVTTSVGDPDYAAAGYMAAGYQLMDNSETAVVSGELTHGPVQPVGGDDGINFMNLRPEDVIESIAVSNGPTVQKAALAARRFGDAAEMLAELNGVKTEIELTMKPVSGVEFMSSYDVDVSALMVPKGIDMEAV